MSVQAALVAYLKTVPAITALVGTSPARIRAFERKQGEVLPALTYFRVSGESQHFWNQTSSLTRSRFQIDCWANTHQDALDLHDAVKASTDSFRGIFSSVPIHACIFGGTNPEAEERSSDQNTAYFRQSLDWLIRHG